MFLLSILYKNGNMRMQDFTAYIMYPMIIFVVVVVVVVVVVLTDAAMLLQKQFLRCCEETLLGTTGLVRFVLVFFV